MNKIEFIGYSGVHSKEFVFDIPGGHDCYLLLLIKSPAEFWVDGEIRQVAPNSAILYTPGHKIYYRAYKQEYKNDFLRFHSDEPFVAQFPLVNTPFPVSDPAYCHNLFKLLTWETSFESTSSESIISHLLRVLFAKLHESTTESTVNVHAQALMELHKKIYNTPQLPWSVSNMAQELHLSTGYLQALYKQMFGSSCMDDVIEGRLRRAQDQLMFSSKSIQEIAEDCGYNNVEHFCRQFRQYNGCSPGKFRKTNRVLNPTDVQALSKSHSTLGGSVLDPEHYSPPRRSIFL